MVIPTDIFDKKNYALINLKKAILGTNVGILVNFLSLSQQIIHSNTISNIQSIIISVNLSPIRG